MIKINRGIPSTELKKEISIATKDQLWLSINQNDTQNLRHAFDAAKKLKELVRKELIMAQHNLCAYCMCNIILKNDFGKTTVKIEHYNPICFKNNSNCKSDTFDFNNYLITCEGGTSDNNEKNRILCCDSAKGNKAITIDPTNPVHIANIFYHSDGIIDYSDITNLTEENKIKDDINLLLQLNGTWNKMKNKSVYDTTTKLINRRQNAYNEAESDILELIKQDQCTEDVLLDRINKIQAEHWEFEGVYTYVYTSYINKGRNNGL